MKRIIVAAMLAASASPAVAQQAATASAPASASASVPANMNSARAAYEGVKGFITRAAEQMPEADYAFKATPEVRSFGQLVGHIANANYMICSMGLGEQNPSRENIETARTTKAALVEALKASFAYCDRAYAMADAELIGHPLTMFGMQTTRLGALAFNAAHDFEHYGNMVTYMRLKGMTPPSSQR